MGVIGVGAGAYAGVDEGVGVTVGVDAEATIGAVEFVELTTVGATPR